MRPDPTAPRRPWQRILTLLCLPGFLVFFLPVFGGILGLANLCGMGGFLALAGIIWWWPSVARLLKWLWGRVWGRLILILSGLGLAALLVTLTVLCGLVIGKLHASPEGTCRTLIVLGCQVRGEKPSLLLWHRIQTAADYLSAHPQAVAIVSGGRGSGEEISEAECMYRGLTARGIAPERIWLEDRSTVTLENLTFSRQVMEEQGLEGPILLVSSDFHIYRALRMARDQGIEAQALAAPSAWYAGPTYVLREAMATVKYLLTARLP